MRLKVRFMKVHLYRIAVVLIAWIVSGCVPQIPSFPTYMQPELLYLNDPPYSRLYVEVDTIEGVEVPDQWLDELKAYLETYCSKPDGVEIVRHTPVLVSKVKGMPIGAVNILCTDGPPPGDESQPAYLHILFYDDNIGMITERGGPRVMTYCPTGIFFNVTVFRSHVGVREDQVLKHELGHVLGLCENPEHCDEAHCQHRECLMFSHSGFLPEFGLLHGSGVDNLLCADCRKDLETLQSKDPDPKLSFKGPFLIRREDGYSVASLPSCDTIIPGDVEFDWRELLFYLKKETREGLDDIVEKIEKARKRRNYIVWYLRAHWIDSQDKKEEITLLTKAVDDPNPSIKRYAINMIKQLKKEKKHKQ